MNSPGLIERVWWRQRPWLDYGAKLVRYYSLRRYRLQFNPNIPAAGVSHELRTIWLNPRWPTPPEWLGEASASGEASAKIRFLKPGRDKASTDHFHLAMLKGFIAHEAGHIRFSCAKPPGLLGDLWNALEDERVERLMAKDHPELRAPFTLLGDLFAAKARATFTGDALEGCLLWRWCWDQKAPLWHPTDPRWAEVKPLVERAWKAPSSEDVIAIAREILALLSLPEEQPPDPRFEQLGADGGGAEEEDAEQGAGDGSGEQQPGDGAEPQAGGGDDEQGGGEGDNGRQPGGGNADQQPGDGNKNRKGRGGKEPTPPSDLLDEVEGEAAGILLDIDGYARDLAEALKPPLASRLARPHRTRGRFAYDRFRAGSERCYRLKPVEHNRPLEVRVCLDLSASMGELSDPTSNMHFAMRACALVVQACAIASVPITVYGFNYTTKVLVEKGITGDEALLRLARVKTGGSTLLGPALKRALEGADRNHVVVVICDGLLTIEDGEVCSDLVRRSGINVLPLLIGDAAHRGSFPGFERHLAVAELGELPGLIRAWFLAKGK